MPAGALPAHRLLPPGRLIGSAPLGWLLVESIGDLADPANSELGTTWLGVGPPLVIGVAVLLAGVLFMVVRRFVNPRFRAERPTVAEKLRRRGA